MISEAQLQAAFLAARKFNEILDDNVLRAIIEAAANADQSNQHHQEG